MALVITPKKDEKIILNDEVELQISKTARNGLRVAIKAPRTVKIKRIKRDD